MQTTPPALYLALILLGLAVGAGMASQAGINAELRRGLGSPLQAAFISFAIGTLLLGTLVWFQREPLPTGASGLPWWAWLGGVLGAFNITASLILAPRLGALALVAVVTSGQVLTSLLLDHRGWLGFPQQPVTASRLLGGALVLVGLLLVLRR